MADYEGITEPFARALQSLVKSDQATRRGEGINESRPRIPQSVPNIFFKLKDDLVSGGTAQAYPLAYSATSYDYVVPADSGNPAIHDESKLFTVKDFLKGPPAFSGACGVAVGFQQLFSSTLVNAIISLDRSMTLWGTLAGVLAATDATVNVTITTPTDPLVARSPILVRNPLGAFGSSGDLCLITCAFAPGVSGGTNPYTQGYHWTLIGVKQTQATQEVVSAVSFDIATGSWRKKTRTVSGIFGTESSWTPYVAGLQAGSSYQRDPVTVTVTPSSGLVYGKPCRITMAVAPVSGTGTAAVTGYREIMIDDTYADASQLITDPNSWQTGYYMTAGTHSLVGVYGGDANYNGNTSSPQSVSVAKATPSLSETHSPSGDTFEYGTQVTWTVVLNPGDIDLTQGSRNGNIGVNSIPSGNVTMTCDGVSFNQAAHSITFNGTAEFKFNIDHPLGAGSRTIVFTYEGDTNYNTCTLSKTLTITKKALTYTTRDASKVYGEANPAFPGTWSGWVVGSEDGPTSLGGNGIPTTTTTAITTSPATQYPIITIAGPCSSTNYDFHFVNSVLTITKANLVVTASSISVTQGDPVPEYTGSIAGIQPNDTAKIHLALTSDYTTNSESKWYTIHADVTGDGSVLDSYTIEKRDAAFFVRKASL